MALKTDKLLLDFNFYMMGYMMNQSFGGWCVSGSGERRKKRQRGTGLHPLAVVGSTADIEAPIS